MTWRRELVVLTARPGGGAGGGRAVVVRDREGAAAILDLPHGSDEARARFGRRRRLPVDGLLWLDDEGSPPAPDGFEEAFRLSLDSHVGWRPPASDQAVPGDVVRQVSFLAAAEGYDAASFRSHYRHHVEVAGRHMPALWQYVQNDVVASTATSDAGRAIVAVSELWFRTTADFLHRYFASDDDQAQFQAQEGFLDLNQASSFICTSHRVAPG